jgi:Fic family protein
MRTTGFPIPVSTTGVTLTAFVPEPLPPATPLALTQVEADLLDRANVALGRLDSATWILPDSSLIVYLYIRKEAVLSSQIEGTQSSLSDLLLLESKETPGVPINDAVEVLNYVKAMKHGLERLKTVPLSINLLKEIHGVLLDGGRGSHTVAGNFRRHQVWVGGDNQGRGASFVPPPANEIDPAMNALENFINDEPSRTGSLIKAALAHVQFETIHPFHDGNGRLGRLLITLLLCNEGVLKHPILYLSLYFKTHRDEYYARLQSVRVHGDWEGWLRFFLEGVISTAEKAVALAQQMLALFNRDRAVIQERLGRKAARALRVHEELQKHPLARIPALAKATGLSAPTVTTALENLRELNIVEEPHQKTRNRSFCYRSYLRLLEERTDAGPVDDAVHEASSVESMTRGPVLDEDPPV